VNVGLQSHNEQSHVYTVQAYRRTYGRLLDCLSKKTVMSPELNVYDITSISKQHDIFLNSYYKMSFGNDIGQQLNSCLQIITINTDVPEY